MSRRNALPKALPGATEFSDQPEMQDQLWAIRKLKRQPQWLQILTNGTRIGRNHGRPRITGSWALVYLAFVVSGRCDIEPWWASTSDDVWVECGFSGRPSYPTVWNRFTELEKLADAFSETAGHLIRHARVQSGGLVGQDIHVDGSEAETNARLQHDCDGSSCGRAQHPKRLHTDDARSIRHGNDAEPPPDDPDSLDTGEARDVEVDDSGGIKRIKVGRCWYRTRDRSAGVRAYYQGQRLAKFWHGFLNDKAVDHFTGAPLAIQVVSASVQEFNAYPKLIEEVERNLGCTPRAMVGDRGLSTKAVYELNTRKGIATVVPFRKSTNRVRREDYDDYDRHGVPRCKFCGGPSRYLRFAAKPYPRIWFRCELGVTNGCGADQSIACSRDWRTLLPLWRTEEAYFALRSSHANYERTHRVWRDRYRVGGATHEMRPKRMGLGWQQLRANAALLVEWIRVLDREGWNGSARRNRNRARVETIGARPLENLMMSRSRNGLMGPYGRFAVSSGQGRMRPTRSRANAPPGA